MVQLVDSAAWEAPIGRVFLAFGSIEHAVHLALRDIPLSRVAKSASRMPLAARIDLLLEILEGHDGAPFDVLSKTLLRVKSLAKLRNIPAHNGLIFSFFESAAGEFGVEQFIASMHNPKHKITLDELINLAKSARDLADALHSELATIRKINLSK